MSWCVASFSESGGSPVKTGAVYLDTLRLADLLEALEGRRDEPVEVAFAWVRPAGWAEADSFEAALEPGDLHLPIEVLACLSWLEQRGQAGDPALQEEFKRQSGKAFSRQGFSDWIRNDVAQIRDLCTRAAARGDRIATFVLP